MPPSVKGKELVGGDDPLRTSVAKLYCFKPNSGTAVTAASGVFISKDTILTVGHAVFSQDTFGTGRQGFADSIEAASPWLDFQEAATDRIDTTRGWKDGNRDLDIGLVKLNASVPGAMPLPIRALTDAAIQNLAFRVYGFPFDSDGLHCNDSRCRGAEPGRFFYDAQVGPGESGAPLVAGVGHEAGIVGLHRAGSGEAPPGFPNAVVAVRLTEAIREWIVAKMNLL